MTNIFIYSIIVYGICNILIWGSNFSWWRNLLSKFGTGNYSLHKLFTCFMCLGFWVGVVLSGAGLYYGVASLVIISTPNIYLTLFLGGAFSSGICWIINTAQEWLEKDGSDLE